MELRNIKTFQRAAELNSFSRTAEELGYTQSAVTIQIRQLENELGVRLFERIGKRIRLTAEGETFLDYARRVSDCLQEAVTSLSDRNEITGTLRIGTSESLCSHLLPDLLREFNEKLPKVRMQIEMIPVTKMIPAVLKNKIDILLFIDSPAYDQNLVRGFSLPISFHFVTAPTNPITKKKRLTLQEILKEPLALTEKGLSYRDELDRFIYAKGLELDPMIVCDHADLIMELIQKNNYIGYLPDFMTAESKEHKRLVRLPYEIPSQMQLQAVYHKNKQITPQMRTFIDLLENLSMPVNI